MAISERQRHGLHTALRGTLGEEHAGVLMELVPSHDRDQLATKSDVAVLSSDLRAEMSELGGELRAEMGALSGELRAEMGALSGELRAEMSELRGDFRAEMAELRGDMDRQFGQVDRRFGEVLEQMSSQTRQHTMGLVGFAVATWGALLGSAVLG